ncbi:Probable efflux pump outer membrane protein ttgC precursor [Chromobacterium violaceum]|uniref:Probable efflux pump outer membrane protein ttgC n=1 Tax=Chromobacterium violaceum TaxID=536 RepID=A0A3S5DLD5_CHRVL|nr:Probable efflux pump outer membrane protein ttgC precursor [Chromobacterium violaceum]
MSLPSDLARQRPDIRASEALLHQASANVGVATANQYPQITLSGSYGTQHTVLPNTDLGNTLWSVSGGLLQPLFNGGALSAKRRAAEAAYRQAEAQYRTTVLKAFQDVADSLRAVDADARRCRPRPTPRPRRASRWRSIPASTSWAASVTCRCWTRNAATSRRASA